MLERAGDVLAHWIALLLPVVDPDVVVFGGSAGLAVADALLPAARERLAARASLRGIGRLPELSISRCGPGAAAAGAALTALRVTQPYGRLTAGGPLEDGCTPQPHQACPPQ